MISSAPQGSPNSREIALYKSTKMLIEFTSLSFSTLFNKTSMLDLAPFLVLNFWKASRQTLIAGFSLKIDENSKCLYTSLLAFFKISCTYLGLLLLFCIFLINITPNIELGNKSQNDLSTINFFILTHFYSTKL